MPEGRPQAWRRESKTPEAQDSDDIYSELNHQVDQLLKQEESGEPFVHSPSAMRPRTSPEIPSFRASTYSSIQRYQPGQTLAPIHTGETLRLTHEPPPQLPELVVYPNPFMNPSFDTQYPDRIYEEDSQPYFHLDHAEEDMGLSAPDPHAGEVDHFAYDAEAYASGLRSRGPLTIPRSRSPTPFDSDDSYIEEDHVTISPHGRAYAGEKLSPSTSASTWVSTLNPNAPIHDEKHDLSVYSEPGTPSVKETRHFGPAPMGRVTRRHRSMKRMKVTTEKVKLINGCLVLDIPIASGLMLPRKGVPEMMHTRYTGVICDPDDFEGRGLFLRQNAYGRRTEMFIVITMYNVR